MKELASSFSVDKVAVKHDFRKGQLPNNVDPSRVKDNVIFIDNLQGRSIEEYTNDEMQPFIDEHNARQKRKDRKINSSYTEWHMSDKNMMKGIKEGEEVKWAWEAVLCYGNHEDYWHEYFDPNTPEWRKEEMYNQAIEEYRKMVYAFQIKYPHLEILYAVLHADEPQGSIHCHLCFQGRGRDYERGLTERVSISRALEQDGFTHFHNASQAKEEGGFQMERMFKDFRHNVMNESLLEMGFEIKDEEHGKKHLSSNAYRELMTKATQVMDKAKKEAEQIVSAAVQRAEAIDAFAEELETINDIEQRPLFDPTQIQKVQVKKNIFSQPEEMVQMTPEMFDAHRSSSDTKTINKRTEEKIKKQNEAIAKAIETISTDKEKELTIRVNELEDRLEKAERKVEERDRELVQKDNRIKTLDRLIDKVEELIKRYAPSLLPIFNRIITIEYPDRNPHIR